MGAKISGQIFGKCEQAVNFTTVTLAVLDTWYEVAKITAFECKGNDVLINAVSPTVIGAGNGLLEARILIGVTVKCAIGHNHGDNSVTSLSLTWLERSCAGTNDIAIEVRAHHASTVGATVNRTEYPSVINAVRFPWRS